ncbi:sucrose synthase 2 [Senna tora]|uniref:sucrose synthase n=1 Tax=Senna tora TaxID=362788 RepID=A0A834W7Q4_9FABA|nr:sucrose synthase 2 [Senna tora]
MKKIALLALTLSLSLLPFFSTTTSTAVVLDTDGDAVQNGGSYYILSAYRGKGGGLGLDRTSIIKEGYPLILRFVAVPLCTYTASWWTVVKDSGHAVKLTGFYENALSGSFTIEKNYIGYKLKFRGWGSDTCADVGVYFDEKGVRQLVIMGEADQANEIEKIHGLMKQYNLDGDFRWITAQTNRALNGELYHYIADTKGAFIQPAIFYEAFGLTVLCT